MPRITPGELEAVGGPGSLSFESLTQGGVVYLLLFFMFITWFIRPQPYTCLGIDNGTGVHPILQRPV